MRWEKVARMHNKETLKSSKSAQQGATEKQQELTIRRHQRATWMQNKEVLKPSKSS